MRRALTHRPFPPVPVSILSVSFFLLTGTVGFLACLGFVRIIYSSVKLE